MNFRNLIIALLILTGLRLAYIGQIELSPDEAYYHEWSQRLDTCYFSKGPGIALTMRASTAIFGHSEFGVRFFAPVLALGTSLLLYWLARRIFDARVAFWTVVLLNVTPLFNACGLIMTIDPLSIFFWTATLCTAWLALEKRDTFSLWWPATGLLIGLGFLCKFTNAMQLLSLFLLLALTPGYRRELLRPGFWSVVIIPLLFAWPIYRWNELHGFPTTHHLAARGGLATAWWQLDLPDFGQFVGLHFLVYGPLIFAALLWTLIVFSKDSIARWTSAFVWSLPAIPGSLRKHPVAWIAAASTLLGLYFFGNALERPELHTLAIALGIAAALIAVATLKDEPNIHWKPRFLIAFAFPLVALYLWIALHHDAEVNWTAPASLSLAILTVSFFAERIASGGVWKKTAIAAIALSALITIIALSTPRVRTRLTGWASTAKVVQDFRDRIEQQTGKRVFLIADDYGTAAALCYYLPEKRIEAPGHPPVYVPESPEAENQFHFWPRYDEYEARNPGVPVNEDEDSREYGVNKFAGRTALYITDREESEPASVLLPSFFTRTEGEPRWSKQKSAPWRQFAEFEIKQGDRTLRTLRIFILPHYQPGKVLD